MRVLKPKLRVIKGVRNQTLLDTSMSPPAAILWLAFGRLYFTTSIGGENDEPETR